MKRKTVTPNLPVLLPMIKKKCRSYVVFAKEIRGKDKSGWVTEWSRGNNYPSPEEAARICIFLNTTPDEILMHEGKTPEETAKCLEDIETVRKLVEDERGKEKAPNFNVEGWTDLQKAAIQFVLSLPPEKLEVFLKMGRAAFEEKEHE